MKRNKSKTKSAKNLSIKPRPKDSGLGSISFNKLGRILGYQFKDRELAEQALSHRSSGSQNYERLEFLGDAVLGMVISMELFDRKPDASEGDLSRMRARLVRGETLAEIAREHELGQFLLLGEGELKSGGHLRDSILADIVESLIGAVCVEAGLEESGALVRRLLADRLSNLPDIEELKDPKTRLQELLQARQMERPEYTLLSESGEAHQKSFTMQCFIDPLEVVTEATDSSRRKAEQIAASLALEHPRILALAN